MAWVHYIIPFLTIFFVAVITYCQKAAQVLVQSYAFYQCFMLNTVKTHSYLTVI